MKRREFVTLLGSAAAAPIARPVVARAHLVMAGVFTEALMGALAVIWLMRWVVGRRA